MGFSEVVEDFKVEYMHERYQSRHTNIYEKIYKMVKEDVYKHYGRREEAYSIDELEN